MDVNAYLKRIGYKGTIDNTISCLKLLQKAHLLSVPFENLDIHYDRPITLSVDHFYKKVVEQGRGGFCYELNGLFHELLHHLGFDVIMISAQVFDGDDLGADFDHLALVVTIDGQQYLCDVGFGEFACLPLRIDEAALQHDPRGIFHIKNLAEGQYIVSKIVEGKEQKQYQFQLLERQLSEFEDMCHFHQTDPSSHFTQQKMISLAKEKGRVTLTNNQLKITNSADPDHPEITEVHDFAAALLQYFGISESNLIN